MALSSMEERLRSAIRDVPDFPTAGILFKDITTLLQDGPAFHASVQALCEPYRRQPPEVIACIESRGFPFGAAIAYELGCGLVLIRKPGKLPAATETVTYELEYGEDSLEIHRDALAAGQQVLLVDDLLATGGTASASVELVERLDARVTGLAFLIELEFLDGRRRLAGRSVHSVVTF